MIKIIIYLFLLYLLFRKIYKVVIKTIENYNNKMHYFSVQIADTPHKRERGLMNIKSPLKRNTGMLFDFKKESIISLWMKNTYIPLEALFLDRNSNVVDVAINMEPQNIKNYKSKKKAKYALEVNNGTIKKLGIKIGDKIGTKLLKKNITDFKL